LNSQEILQQIESEISRLQQVKALLQGSNHSTQRAVGRPQQSSAAAAGAAPKRVLSAAARKKIAAAQRRRWAKVRKAQAAK